MSDNETERPKNKTAWIGSAIAVGLPVLIGIGVAGEHVLPYVEAARQSAPSDGGARNVVARRPQDRRGQAVSLRWSNRRGGALATVSFSVTDAYTASRGLLESCLEKPLGAYAANKKSFEFAVGSTVLLLNEYNVRGDFTGASWSRIFDALGSCSESAETMGSRGDLKKK